MFEVEKVKKKAFLKIENGEVVFYNYREGYAETIFNELQTKAIEMLMREYIGKDLHQNR